MKKLKSKKGITLISLIITILVLIILAGVSINAGIGKNGIIGEVKDVEKQAIISEEQEFIDMAYSLALDRNLGSVVTAEQMQKKLDSIAGKGKAKVTDNKNGTLTIRFVETGNEYKIEVYKPEYTQADIDATLDYFTFDASTGVLTSEEEKIGLYEARTFPVKVAVFPKEINGVPVTAIEGWEDGGRLLSNSKDLEKVIILAEIETIGSWDYMDCTNLKSIKLPDSVKSISTCAFDGCTSLTSIEIPNSVTSIETHAFTGCTSLTRVTIPDSVTSIGTHVFNGCTGLISVTISSSVTSIESNAFDGCVGLTSVIIPSSVTSIESSAFSGCTSLTNVYYEGTEEQWEAISISSGNTNLVNANITFNV